MAHGRGATYAHQGHLVERGLQCHPVARVGQCLLIEQAQSKLAAHGRQADGIGVAVVCAGHQAVAIGVGAVRTAHAHKHLQIGAAHGQHVGLHRCAVGQRHGLRRLLNRHRAACVHKACQRQLHATRGAHHLTARTRMGELQGLARARRDRNGLIVRKVNHQVLRQRDKHRRGRRGVVVKLQTGGERAQLAGVHQLACGLQERRQIGRIAHQGQGLTVARYRDGIRRSGHCRQAAQRRAVRCGYGKRQAQQALRRVAAQERELGLIKHQTGRRILRDPGLA